MRGRAGGGFFESIAIPYGPFWLGRVCSWRNTEYVALVALPRLAWRILHGERHLMKIHSEIDDTTFASLRGKGRQGYSPDAGVCALTRVTGLSMVIHRHETGRITIHILTRAISKFFCGPVRACGENYSDAPDEHFYGIQGICGAGPGVPTVHARGTGQTEDLLWRVYYKIDLAGWRAPESTGDAFTLPV